MLQSPPTRTNKLVRVAKSAFLGFPQVKHLFKTGGLCNPRSGFNHFEYRYQRFPIRRDRGEVNPFCVGSVVRSTQIVYIF